MNWNRFSAFCCLAGLTLFVPAILLPSMLVANAIDGPRWYSVWSGIREFYRSGEFFLAGLIACFSLAFPLLKFGLGLLCTVGRPWLPPARRHTIVTLTSWTAKYSMLDVLVIAMLILLVKVNEYVRILPSIGLYLFSATIFLSALASATLRRALAAEAHAKAPATPTPARHLRPLAWALLLILASAATYRAAQQVIRDNGGAIQTVSLARLTNRGQLRRSVEKTLALKEILKQEHDLFSGDTLKRLLEFGQSVATDAGWKAPEAWVAIETTDGRTLTTNHLPAVNLDDPHLALTFTLPSTVARQDIAALRLVSNIQVLKFIDAPIDEEIIRRADDPFRNWTRTWHGRIFSLELQGAPSPGFRQSLAQLALGALACLGSAAALLTPSLAPSPTALPKPNPAPSP